MLFCVWFNQVCPYEKHPGESYTCSCRSKPQTPGGISPASTQDEPPSQSTENFNYTRILEAESEGAALIAEGNNWFCPLRGENVSILRRSGCPPPVGGDKTPWHCGCLICVTALVCAEIDVAFTRPRVGLRGGGLFLLAPPSRIHSDLWEPFEKDLHQYRYSALHLFQWMFLNRIKEFVMMSATCWTLDIFWHLGGVEDRNRLETVIKRI